MNDCANARRPSRAVACLDLALPHLDPPGERVLIPYESKHLAGNLRKPRDVARPPLVLMTMGLDSTKEELLTFEDNFLAAAWRSSPSMVPARARRNMIPIRADYEAVTGAVIDWVEREHRDIDADRIGIWGISLGGYYAPRSAAFEKRLKACIANCGPWDFGALWDSLPELTRLAFIARSHCANDTEGKQRAHALSLAGVADKIECPLFVIAGGLDRLCPPDDARRLAEAARGPVELLVIDDGNHVAHNRFYQYRERPDWMAKQLGVTAPSCRPIRTYQRSGGGVRQCPSMASFRIWFHRSSPMVASRPRVLARLLPTTSSAPACMG